MAGRPARDKLDEYPKHTDVDRELKELRQLTRDMKVARAYEKSLRMKHRAKILAIRAKRKPNGDVVGVKELGEAADLSPQRIQQIMGGR